MNKQQRIVNWLHKKERELKVKPGEMEYGLPVTERYLVIIGGKGWTPAAIIEEIQNGTEYGVKFLNLFSKMPEDEWDLQFPPGDY